MIRVKEQLQHVLGGFYIFMLVFIYDKLMRKQANTFYFKCRMNASIIKDLSNVSEISLWRKIDIWS